LGNEAVEVIEATEAVEVIEATYILKPGKSLLIQVVEFSFILMF